MNKELTQEEREKVREEWNKSITPENFRTYSEVAISVLGQERWDEVLREEEEWRENTLLFKVCHPDGSEWTNEELMRWSGENENSLICDPWAFYINDESDLILVDKCGNSEEMDRNEFVVKWSRKPLERILRELDEDE